MTGTGGLTASRKLGVRRRAPVGAPVPAPTEPVARVLVESGLPHLDRTFDYLVPDRLDAEARPGVRVRVRFAGRLVSGYLTERSDTSDAGRNLSFLERVVSPEPVLTPEIVALARQVADRYGGTVEDVLRLAVPKRHAEAERSVPGGPAGTADPAPTDDPGTAMTDALGDPMADAWLRYSAGGAFLSAVSDGRPARAVWQALPGEDWAARLAELARVALAAGRGTLILVPDGTDLARINAAMTRALGSGRHIALSADVGPAARYRRFLAVLRGHVQVVVGTRAAAFAPVAELGLLAIWDDGDDLHAELRAPYPHAREVLKLRSAAAQTALLIGGYARTAESQLLVESGWAHPLVASRSLVRAAAPRVEVAGDDRSVGADSAAAHARLSPAAFAAARGALDGGFPVLVQVPRSGYQPALACVTCRRPARCRHCSGPLHTTTGAPLPACRWCGRTAAGWRCSGCGNSGIRAAAIGADRTAEEIGRAFPGVPVVSSTGAARLSPVDAPVIVIATPGAEPAATNGYGAALLLDGSVFLSRPDLRAGEEALRRWLAASALVRAAPLGGRVVINADGLIAAVQALVRWDPGWHASRELADRRALGFPPAVAMAAVEGSPAAVASFLSDVPLPEGAEVLGPVLVESAGRGHDGDEDAPTERALVRIGVERTRELAAAVHAGRAARSARKDPDPARVRMDPVDLT